MKEIDDANGNQKNSKLHRPLLSPLVKYINWEEEYTLFQVESEDSYAIKVKTCVNVMI